MSKTAPKTDFGNTLRAIARESALNQSERNSLRLIAKEVDKAAAREQALREAFDKYGTHRGDCNIWGVIPLVKNDKKICDCGFETALQGDKPEKDKV